MRIIKFGLPIVIVVAAVACTANQELRQHELLTADAGALPEATLIATRLYGPRRAISAPTTKTAGPRMAEAPLGR